MKKLLSLFIALIVGLLFYSCSKEGAPSSSSGILGAWDVSLIIGPDQLNEIASIKIDKSTITMSFKKGYYGYLYKEYGPSNIVHYTYNANDVDVDGKRAISLTFDKPLYFVEYSPWRDYISKVIIDVDGNEFIWSDYDLTHGLLLSK